jgi:hypothetical protein
MGAEDDTAWVVVRKASEDWMTKGVARLPIALALLGALGCGRSSRSDVSGDNPNGNPLGTGGTHGASGGSAGKGEGARAGDAGASGGTTMTGSSSVNLDGSPIYTRVQRLTVQQWEHAVTDILRFEATANLSEGFATPVEGAADFTNNERLLYVDPRGALDFEAGSEAAAALATGTPEALARLDAGTDRADFVGTLGRRAFRRPLTVEERTRYEGVFSLGEELYGPGFANGAALVIRAMLQSPGFLYRTELGPAGEPLDGYEAASKLSFWLLGTTPSEALLDAAAAGELDSVGGLESVALQMLEAPSALDVMRDFHGQAYRLSRYATIEKQGVAEYGEAASAELAEASYRFFDRVFEEDGGLRELLTSSRAFVGPGLAPLYGMDAPQAMEERALDASRVGYFLQVPFLLLFSANREPGTMGRGIALNAEVLCNRLTPPPAEIPPIPTPVDGQTNRERIEQLTAGCGDCHRVFVNPLGFALEAFDGIGGKRELDNDRPVDTSGSYPFADGERHFADAKELMQIMADTTQAHTCYAKRVTGYALQRDVVEDDRPLLEELSAVSRNESLKALVIALVRDPAFRLRAEGTP